MDRCIAAIATRSLDPFAGWGSYARGRYVSSDATVLVGLGTLRYEGQPLGYCIASSGQSESETWTEDVAALFDEIQMRLDTEVFRPVDARAPGLPPNLGQRIVETFDEAVFAVSCSADDHPGVFVDVRWADGFTTTALPADMQICNPRED
ncbi:hypothetical protein jaqu_29470 [Jannaschia aquimarina]|uniref:Uncharacterized protein n=1 Tax=Jannaschia aquimarina TaxID=935700 RepID=A0A0D1CKP5_9RHOB|nr:hypothetical protein jaqu_29470 [Jannaschia aquimarina]SNS51448.1 hypothetical protein SAMN05421775_101261 [Jannaschia aquimarina]